MKKTTFKRKTDKVFQQTSTSISEPVCADLPQDIISDILIRLPVKTLTAFKCVCKPWLNIISNPKFIKTHLSKSLLSNNSTNHRLILSHIVTYGTYGYSSILKSCSLNFTNSSNNAVILDYPTRNNLRRCCILGSCNGLVCVMNNEEPIFLWNPCTKKSKELPVSPVKYHGLRSTSYGFGYDQTNDDYKVVCIASYYCVGSYSGREEVTVYSLRTDSWKKINDFPLSSPYGGHGKYVNGILHWKVGPRDAINKPGMVIISFDLGKETYGRIPQPFYDESVVYFVNLLSLRVLQECLSIFCHSVEKPDERACVSIWVMKEYSVSHSWTKMYTIPYTNNPNLTNPLYIPLCISMTGEILFSHESRLVLYNLTNGRFSNPKLANLSRNLLGLSAITYVESLVSPNNYDEVPDPLQ